MRSGDSIRLLHKKMKSRGPTPKTAAPVFLAAFSALVFCGFPPAREALTSGRPSALSASLQIRRAKRNIPAPGDPIAAGGFKFRIAAVTFDKTAMGFVPVDIKAGERVVFVEFEVLEGEKNAFKILDITVSSGSGKKTKPFVLISDGIMHMLTASALRNKTPAYEPGKETIAFVYTVPEKTDQLRLNFPAGETVDLTPLIKK